MRHAVAFLILASPTVVHADRGGTAFDLGLVHNQVAVTDQTAFAATSIRFAIRFQPQRMRYLHFGAEAEEGKLRGRTPLPGGVIARSTTPTDGSPIGGNTLALKLLVGAHGDIGPFRVGGGFAAGMRDTWVESDAGMDVAGRKYHPLLEVRSRIDYRITRTALIGATASSDVIERRDVSVALVFSLDFTD